MSTTRQLGTDGPVLSAVGFGAWASADGPSDGARRTTTTRSPRCDVAAAARMLGTTRETLRYRIRKYGITTPD
jgi:hypothetical protein